MFYSMFYYASFRDPHFILLACSSFESEFLDVVLNKLNQHFSFLFDTIILIAGNDWTNFMAFTCIYILNTFNYNLEPYIVLACRQLCI